MQFRGVSSQRATDRGAGPGRVDMPFGKVSSRSCPTQLSGGPRARQGPQIVCAGAWGRPTCAWLKRAGCANGGHVGACCSFHDVGCGDDGKMNDVICTNSPHNVLVTVTFEWAFSLDRHLGTSTWYHYGLGETEVFIAPRTLATSGRRPGVRAKRAACGVTGRQLWTGRREKTVHPFTAIIK